MERLKVLQIASQIFAECAEETEFWELVSEVEEYIESGTNPSNKHDIL